MQLRLPFVGFVSLLRPLGVVFLMILAAVIVGPKLQAQTTVTVTVQNPSFETPTPSVFPDYTLGATDWTRWRSDIDSGTYAPGGAATPAPVDGAQVGYANGFGGLQQVLTTSFVAGTTYDFSVWAGLRSDSVDNSGSFAVQLGYFTDGTTFNLVTAQSGTPLKGSFDLVSGSYQASASDAGRVIVLRLANIGNPQVIFDQVTVSATAIPEPAVVGGVLGAVALVGAMAWRRRQGRVMNNV